MQSLQSSPKSGTVYSRS